MRERSGDEGGPCLGSLVGESSLRMQMSEFEMLLSRAVPLAAALSSFVAEYQEG